MYYGYDQESAAASYQAQCMPHRQSIYHKVREMVNLAQHLQLQAN